MRLKELCNFEKITIQCHNNPDADAIASGFAAYRYFELAGKQVDFIYCGYEISKPNLNIMVNELGIPIKHKKDTDASLEGLLLLVDCQYGESNVTRLKADCIAVIDHHYSKGDLSGVSFVDVRPQMGACSTILWQLLKRENYFENHDSALETALYYGLMTDTENFIEAHHPADLDMRDELSYDRAAISSFVNSNISLKELEIAGIALIRNNYNSAYRYSVAKTEPCDANVLGMIIDIIKTVDGIDTCVVYCEAGNGYKFSVRSVTKNVRAGDLAKYISLGIGSAGGHIDKAGGYCDRDRFLNVNGSLEFDTYINSRIATYYDSCEIIDTDSYSYDCGMAALYKKRKISLGYVDPLEVVEEGTELLVRTLEGDISYVADKSFYVMIGVLGEVYPIKKEKFERCYKALGKNYDAKLEYEPVMHSYREGKKWNLIQFANACLVEDDSLIYARKLDNYVKIFTSWDKDSYMYGTPGDYIVCRKEDTHDVYVIRGDIFDKTYELA